MANVAVKVLGQGRQFAEANTVGELKRAVNVNSNFTASVAGSPVEDDYELEEDDFVALAPPIKGG